MSLTLFAILYLATCLEGGLLGELFYSYMPLSKLTISPFQESILAYLQYTGIWHVTEPRGRPIAQNQISFSIFSAFYMC